ncbi:Uncharacterised protein [Canicola haemoglobinophilus]|uniref:YbjN domain-containing protein n=1 Tax=Canicola haemoglobinophilus TaxID=733 RepID=A0AB38HES8_9PAST|nr:hypothetical protein [Canicola haemoglobinophilus]STO54232.1 Uncharacterised protein [Canicola haemoglobinophilus]STO68765.1 Uncharacterised protein [Canicola haemoglobinophilus]
MSTETTYKKVKELLQERGFKFSSNDENSNIFITFNTSNSKPVSILIGVEMSGRIIHFYSRINDKVAKDKYFKLLLEENYKYKFVNWSIDDQLQMICSVNLFNYENDLAKQDIVAILELIVSSHVRINDGIALID